MSNQNYLVLVHAKWCPHCPTMNKHARQTWKSIQTKIAKSVAIEESLGKARLPRLMRFVQHYPTVLLITSNNQVKVMDGPFTVDRVLSFYRATK